MSPLLPPILFPHCSTYFRANIQHFVLPIRTSLEGWNSHRQGAPWQGEPDLRNPLSADLLHANDTSPS
eukprot:3098249-Prorocentrum_lima.AAC.1